jgi:acetyltransferase
MSASAAVSASASISLTALAPLYPAATPGSSLRRAGAEDAAALSAFFQGLNAQDRRLRFHGACKGASLALALRLCGVDGVRHQAWLAWVGCGEAAVVVGEARFVVSACGRTAELAMAVAEAWQGQGLADALMRQLLGAASAAGVRELHGEVLDDNLRMQAFMRRHGFEIDPFAPNDALCMTRELRVAAPRPSGGGLLAWLRSALWVGPAMTA